MKRAQVLVQVVDAPRDREHLHDGGLVPGAVAEVGIERRFQFLSSRQQRGAKLLKIGSSLGERRRTVSEKGGALPGEQDREWLRRRGGALVCRPGNHRSGDVENRVGVECTRGQTMAEDDRLAGAPVLEVDPRTVLRREPVHRALSLRSEASAIDGEHGAGQGCGLRFAWRNEVSASVGGRAGVEIDTRTVEQFESL